MGSSSSPEKMVTKFCVNLYIQLFVVNFCLNSVTNGDNFLIKVDSLNNDDSSMGDDSINNEDSSIGVDSLTNEDSSMGDDSNEDSSSSNGTSNRMRRSRCETSLCSLPKRPKCSLQPVTGPCRAAFKEYYWDENLGDCQIFTYGGCCGNGNRFKTYHQCMNQCKCNYKIIRN